MTSRTDDFERFKQMSDDDLWRQVSDNTGAGSAYAHRARTEMQRRATVAGRAAETRAWWALGIAVVSALVSIIGLAVRAAR